MEDLSRVDFCMRYPLEINIPPHLFDHHLEGRCLFPAVEALITLARVVREHFPLAKTDCQIKARFPRFLTIPPESRQISALVDIEPSEKSPIAAKLLTSVRSKSGGIGRHLEHARVEFLWAYSSQSSETDLPPQEALEGQVITVPAESIYRELVPFGKAYQNIVSEVSVSPQGAQAILSGGDGETDNDLLGSPFPFDAAFHLACIWGQRFTESVPFPTGFENRTIHQKTKRGGRYLGRIIPVAVDQIPLTFDALIFDLQGTLCEDIRGIEMQDVSQGRLRPPRWIKIL
ncbi:MAG: hypothetical protein C0407_09105 [Desulfobacca sp.]|nr:hypothetical protein [Desulfobacca sp.]